MLLRGRKDCSRHGGTLISAQITMMDVERCYEDVALSTYNPAALPPVGSQNNRGCAAVAWGSFVVFVGVMLLSACVSLGFRKVMGPRFVLNVL